MKKFLLSVLLPVVLCFAVAPALAGAGLSAEAVDLADTDKVLIRLTDMELSDDDLTLKFYFENRSDITAMFSINSSVVNGYAVDFLCAVEVAPGQKSNQSVVVYDLAEYGITDAVSMIDLEFRVFDSNDWFADDLLRQHFVLYPLGEENAVIREREPQDSDTLLTDNDSVSVTVLGFGEDPLWGYTAYIYLVNKTDTPLTFSCDDVSVNGFMVDPFWAENVPANARCYSEISWPDARLKENGIETVEEIEFTLSAHDSYDWMADNVLDETYVINP